jgi:transcriptional regulator of acetoin/glycerol metabolism
MKGKVIARQGFCDDRTARRPERMEPSFLETIVGRRGGLRAILSQVEAESYQPVEREISNPTLEDKVRGEILAACQRANWELGGPRGAAARLGLKRTTLFYKMKRLGIAPPADHSQD